MKTPTYRALALAAIPLLISIGCGPKPYKFGTPKQVPGWVMAPPAYQDGYAVIGISSPRLSIGTAQIQSEGRARAALGRVLETRVTQMAKDFVETAMEGNTENLAVSEQQFTQSVFSSVSRQTITGARVKDSWVNPDNGEFYTLLVLGKQDVLEVAKKEVLDQARTQRLYGEFRADQAVQEMERIVEQEYGASVQAANAGGQ